MTFWAQFASTVWQILVESAVWVMVSLLLAGLVHEFLPTSRFRRMLERRGHRAMGGAVALGGCLPMCSCGVIPLVVSLYRSGVRVGPVMAFAAATPIINPAAVVLALALLGPPLTAAYVALGLTLPFVLGYVTERYASGTRAAEQTSGTDCCCGPQADARPDDAAAPEPARERAALGLRWGFAELGPRLALYMGIGMALAGLLNGALPDAWAETYLGEGSAIALLAAGVLGASIYVCAVAHIPFVAALLAAGAAPGVAIVFLVTGTATNLPELTALYHTLGRRIVALYTGTLITGAILAGLAVNAWLPSDYDAAVDPLTSLELMDLGESLWPTVAYGVDVTAAVALAALALWGGVRWLRARVGGRPGLSLDRTT